MERIKKILVATDLSPLSFIGLEKAIKIAEKNKSEITIYHVLQKETFFDRLSKSVLPPAKKELIKSRDYVTETIEKALQKHNIENIKINIVIVSGDKAGIKIINFAKTNNIDFIIVGAHGRYTWHDWFIGTTAEFIVKKTHCPVLIIKNKKSSYQKILLPVDLSNASKESVELAFYLFPHNKLQAVYVGDPAYDELLKTEFAHAHRKGKQLKQEIINILTEKIKKFLHDIVKNNKNISFKVVIGYPGLQILEEVKNRKPGLVIMGAHGHSQNHYKWLGSVASRVLFELDKDLLLVPARKVKRKATQQLKEDIYFKKINKLTEAHFQQLKQLAQKKEFV